MNDSLLSLFQAYVCAFVAGVVAARAVGLNATHSILLGAAAVLVLTSALSLVFVFRHLDRERRR